MFEAMRNAAKIIGLYVSEILLLKDKKLGCKNCTKMKERDVRKHYFRGNNRTEESSKRGNNTTSVGKRLQQGKRFKL
jgi:hypothetical protein